MAKRFIDTGLFRKPSIRAMKAPYKALFIYLLCECDHAGVWDVELDVAETRLGMKLDPDRAIAELGGAVVPIGGGSKWWLVDFVEFQYGDLNPSNRVHASVLSRLSSLGIDLKNKPLASPLEGAKDKDKDKDTQEREERAKPNEVLNWPRWAGEQTRAKWAEFITYRKREHRKAYRSAATEQKAIDLACRWFQSGPVLWTALEHTMAKGWQFPVDPAEHKYPAPSFPGMEAPKPVWNPRA